MRKQYTTEEKQNLVAMFKSGTQTTTAFARVIIKSCGLAKIV